MNLLERQKRITEANIQKSFGIETIPDIEKGGKRTGYYANTSENKAKHRVGVSYLKDKDLTVSDKRVQEIRQQYVNRHGSDPMAKKKDTVTMKNSFGRDETYVKDGGEWKVSVGGELSKISAEARMKAEHQFQSGRELQNLKQERTNALTDLARYRLDKKIKASEAGIKHKKDLATAKASGEPKKKKNINSDGEDLGDVKSGMTFSHWTWKQTKGGKQEREYLNVKIVEDISDEKGWERYKAIQLEGTEKGKEKVVYLSQLGKAKGGASKATKTVTSGETNKKKNTIKDENQKAVDDYNKAMAIHNKGKKAVKEDSSYVGVKVGKEFNQFAEIARNSIGVHNFMADVRKIKNVSISLSSKFMTKFGMIDGKRQSIEQTSKNFMTAVKEQDEMKDAVDTKNLTLKGKDKRIIDSTGEVAGNPKTNKLVHNKAKSMGFTHKDMGVKEYQKAMSKAAVEALTDANYHDDARKLVAVLEGKPELAKNPNKEYEKHPFGSPGYNEWKATTAWGSDFMQANKEEHKLGVFSTRSADFDGVEAVNAIAFAMKMDGSKNLAKKIQSIFKSEDVDIKKSERELYLLNVLGIDISKGSGEGSRGGHITGHTKSGKAIYGGNSNGQEKLDHDAAEMKASIASAKKELKQASGDQKERIETKIINFEEKLKRIGAGSRNLAANKAEQKEMAYPVQDMHGKWGTKKVVKVDGKWKLKQGGKLHTLSAEDHAKVVKHAASERGAEKEGKKLFDSFKPKSLADNLRKIGVKPKHEQGVMVKKNLKVYPKNPEMEREIPRKN